MSSAKTGGSVVRKPLRVWPGVVAVGFLLLARFGVKAVVPGFRGFELGIQLAGIGVLAVLLWWLAFSRARWFERLGAVVLMVVGLFTAARLGHPSIVPAPLVGWGVPFLLLAFVAWAVAARRLADGPRRLTMVATILLACGVWTLLRTEGITGDHAAELRWRWTPTSEELLLARAGDEAGAVSRPTAPGPVAAEEAAAAPSPSEKQTAPAVGTEAGEVPAPPGGEVPPEAPQQPAAETAAVGGEASSALPVGPEAESKAAVHGEPAGYRPAPGSGDSALAGGGGPGALPAAPAPVGGWPGFRGPGRDGVVRGVRIETDWAASPPVELWRRPVGPGWSSFAVAGDRVYTQEQRGDNEVVVCYDAATGEPVWIHGDPVRFYESNAGAGPRATPAVNGGRVYALGATGILNALDAATGAVVWSRDAAAEAEAKLPDWGFSGSPLVLGDAVIAAVSGRLVAYDSATGEPRWSGEAKGTSYSSPHLATIDGVAQVVQVSAAGVAGIAPADGTVLWEHSWRGFPIVQPAVTPDGDVLVVASGQSGTRRVTVGRDPGGWSTEERWTSIQLKPYFNDLVVHEGHAYGFDGRILAAIDLETGERRWKGGRYGSGQLVLLPEQDLLLVLSETGELALVSATAERFTELARVPAIEGKTWNHPALVDDLLLVRNGQEMAAFRLARAGG